MKVKKILVSQPKPSSEKSPYYNLESDYGVSVDFRPFINLQKIALAQEKLIFTNTPINKLAHSVGFSQTSYFTKIFKQKVGMTPSKYRKYNSAIKKIYTIPRNLEWRSNKSVYWRICKNKLFLCKSNFLQIDVIDEVVIKVVLKDSA